MNEKLAALLELVQRTAVQAGDAAADAVHGAGKAAEELLSVAKLNIRIMDRKAEVNRAMREVGEMMYATHTGSPTDSEILLKKLREIDDLQAQIREDQEEIRRAEAASTCAACGAPVQEGDHFCRECGGKL